MSRVFRSLAAVALALGSMGAAAPRLVTATVLTRDPPLNSFRPDEAFGAGLDGAGRGDTDRLYTPHNAAAMRAAGLPRVSYRLRTELGIEAWHWNPEGTWSDPAHSQGYWTSSDRPGRPILTTWGYNLPRRGDTIDQANNLLWSKLDDGDLDTFWKSNPYLEPPFSHDRPHPQWLVIELGGRVPVDTARIWWGTPWATRYEVQFWTGADEYDPAGRWVAFPGGSVRAAAGGESRLKLADAPVTTAFLRLWMTDSSGGAGAGDIRDRLGYAVREVAFGRTDASGGFQDAVRHSASHDGQSVAHVSSTDPWHRAIDRDPELEQPGFDRVYRSGLTNGLPMMVPVGVLYDTPDNAAAELTWLKRRGYPVRQVELGEEPDGQYVDAADYGALYLETLDRLRPLADPGVTFGGPSLQSGVSDTWLDPDPDRSWTHHFIRYLKQRERLGDLGFFSFERYPFDDMCGDIGAKLRAQTGLMADLLARFDREEIPRNIPWIISEYGFSAYSGRAMSELPSALLDADIVGQFLSGGGDAAYMFGYGPNWPVNQHLACAGYGNMMLQTADPNGQAVTPMPAFAFSRLLTDAWTRPGHGLHRLHAVRLSENGPPPKGGPAVTAYAVRRPGGDWAVMVVNRDAERPARLVVRTESGAAGGAATVSQYDPSRFQWLDAGEDSRPSLSLPPRRFHVADISNGILLPPYSLSVVEATLH